MKKLILALMALTTTAAHADWLYENDVDEFTDESSHFAITKTGNDFRPSLLGVRCMADGLNVIILMGDIFMHGDNKTMRYRFDKGEPQTATYITSSSGDLMMLAPAYRDDFIENIRKGSKVAIQVKNFQGTNKTQTFSLIGAAVQVNKVVEACNG